MLLSCVVCEYKAGEKDREKIKGVNQEINWQL